MLHNLSPKQLSFLSASVRLGLALALLATTLGVLPAQPAYAASVTVDITTDELDGADGGACASADIADYDGDGVPLSDISLREAICWANASAGADTITLAAGSTYNLAIAGAQEDANATGDLDVTAGTLTIQSDTSGTQATIDGNDVDRVLHVRGGATLYLTDIIVTGGQAPFIAGEYGGGILVSHSSRLDLTRCTVTGNETLFHHGGGIAADGYGGASCTLNVTDSTISNNISGEHGGGIDIYNCSVNITNSTISGNQATVWEDSYGGGIYVENDSTVNITNSTISGNSAIDWGGGISTTGDAAIVINLNFVTVTDNTADSDNDTQGDGGGLDCLPLTTINIQNSIVQGNDDLSDTANDDCTSGTVTSLGGNVVGSGTGCPSGGTGDTTAAANLAALADNGGSTQTHALPVGSAALNRTASGTRGCGSSPTTDQRGNGFGRPDPPGGACDSGAYERDAGELLTINGAGTGNGTVTDTGINCTITAGVTSGDCDHYYGTGSSVVLTATATSGVFTSWTNCDSPSGNQCTQTMGGDETVTVRFDLSQPEMDVQGNGNSITDGDTTPSTTDDTDFGNVLVAGGTVAHTFIISNTGSATLTLSGSPNVTLTTGTHFSVSLQPAVSTIGSGSSTTFQITFDSSAAGSFQDTVNISNDDADENPYTFVISGTGTVPDLSITKSVTPTTPVIPGATITYTLAFSNVGSGAASGVVITDIVPVSVTHSSLGISNSGITITAQAGISYTWAISNIPVGQGGVITITGILSSDLPLGTVFTNTAIITGTGDATSTNNTSSAALKLPYADLAITKTVSPEAAVAGMPLTYTIIITNYGPDTATGIVLSDTLHPSTTLQYLDQTDDGGGDLGFEGGTFEDTHWINPRSNTHSDEWVELLDPTVSPTGVFTSRVIDASNVVAWTTLAWTPRRPTWKPLPDNGQTEEHYALGEANMTANRLLLHLDEAAGATVFSDTSGLDNHGWCPAVVSETCPTAGADGRFNGALSFDGTLSQTVVVTDATDPIRYAIELWVYPTVITDTSFILRTDTLSDTAENYSHLLGIYDGHFRHLVYDGSYRAVASTTPVTINTWYHIVGTAESGGDIKLYVNGELEDKLNGIGTLWQGGDWYRLGSTYGPTGTSQYFSGRLDEVAVYSRTLSSGEINDHYLRGALRLSFQVRSCDDAGCDGETFSAETYSEQSNTSVDLPSVTLTGIPNNRYFQYRAIFETDDTDYSPELRSVTVGPPHWAVVPSQGSCDAPGGGPFTCDLGDLPGGGVITVTMHVNVNPSALGVITNTANVTATGDVSPTNNTAFVTSTVRSKVDLDIYKYDDDDQYWWDYGASDPVNPGSTMTYTLQVHNGGPSTAWDVVVTDTLPITVESVSAPSGWDPCDIAGQTITCTVASLARYSWPHIIITGTAPTTEGWITNTAWVTARASSVYTTSHISDTESTLITPLADLVIVKTVSPDPVDPGEVLTFIITVTNNGPSQAVNLEVVDTLQSGLVAYAIGGNWSCINASASVVSCTLGSLGSGAFESFQITTTAPLSGFVGNQAVVASDTTDPDTDNNDVITYATVRPVADLFIIKDDVLDPVNAAAPLTYTLTITNAGPVPAGVYTSTQDFSNDRYIQIRSVGRAHRYPSNLHVGGVVGAIGDLTVKLHNLSHDYPADLSILVVGPGGQSVVLMSNAGGGVDATDVTLTFDDAGDPMPVSGTLTSTVTYHPTNYGLSREFYSPAPSGPYGGSLSAFNGTNPNGLWRLYVMDTMDAIGGEIAGGWSLHLVAATADVVTLTDSLPAGLTSVNMAPLPGWECDTVTDTWTCTANFLAVDAPAVFTITATSPITGGVITNTAAVTSTTTDFWPDSNTDTITTTITPVADLGITKLVTPIVRVDPSAPLTYTLTVSNAGPSPVQATVVVTDLLPDGLTGVSAPASCDVSALPLVTCTLGGGLGAGAVSDFVITANAPITAGVITNTAGVTTTVADLYVLNNSALVTITVARQADLQVVKFVLPAAAVPDALITYTLNITNVGPSGATYVTVTDVLTNFGSVGVPTYTGSITWDCDQAGGAFTCTVASLDAGVPTSIVFTATAPSVGGVITNVATITNTVEDPILLNNVHVLTTPVSLPPTITVPSGDYTTGEDTTTVITFTVDDADTPLASLLLAATVSDTTLVPPANLAFGDAGNPSGITRTLTITPAADLNGLSTITVTVSDGVSGASDVFTLTVTPVNDPPTFTVGLDQLVNENAGPQTVSGWATNISAGPLDESGQVLTFTLTNDNNGLFSAQPAMDATGNLSFTVQADVTGTAVVTVTLQDSGGTANGGVDISIPQAFTITVNAAPIANAGPDQTVFVDEPVTLDGTSSSDPDGNLPLAYGWQQTGGAPTVSLDSATAVQPTFTAPPAPTVLTFSLTVTDFLGLASSLADTVVITVAERAIVGLSAVNDSPTELGNPTNFTAYVTAGSNVTYQWNFDGFTDIGNPIAHTYGATGTYTAIVTATNSLGSVFATTQVTITEPITTYLYLPLVTRNYAVAPDLVVADLIVASDAITVVIQNQGDAPVNSEFVNEFWVDVYINPDTPPTQVNQTWEHVGSQGLVWGVVLGALPLNPGDVLTLTVGDIYYWSDKSVVIWPLPAGTQVWAQVDSSNAETTYGAVLENHEITGGAYNNISGPVSSTSAGSQSPRLFWAK